MSKPPAIEQRRQELVPQMTFGVNGQPIPPYVPRDPSRYPVEVLVSLHEARSHTAARERRSGIVSRLWGILTGRRRSR